MDHVEARDQVLFFFFITATLLLLVATGHATRHFWAHTGQVTLLSQNLCQRPNPGASGFCYLGSLLFLLNNNS